MTALLEIAQAALGTWRRTPRYGFDIETTGLRWDEAKVTTFAIFGDGVSVVRESTDEVELLYSLLDAFERLDPGVVVTWNGAIFDGPFLAGRFIEHDMPEAFRLRPNFNVTPKYEPQPGFPPIGFDPIFAGNNGEHAHLDVAYGFWRKWADDNGVHWALKPVARAAGLQVIEVDREHMDALSEDERRAYCLSDARAAYELGEMAASAILDPQSHKEPVNA